MLSFFQNLVKNVHLNLYFTTEKYINSLGLSNSLTHGFMQNTILASQTFWVDTWILSHIQPFYKPVEMCFVT